MKRWIMISFLTGTAMTVFAQVGEISISAGKSTFRNNVLGSADRVNYKVEADFRLGFRFTFNNDRFFGHEIGYAYNHGSFKAETAPPQSVGMPVHQGMYNFLIYGTREGSPVRPFVTGGGHFSTFYPPGTSVFSGNGVTKFGYNYGAGIKARVSPMFLVRFDVRNYATAKPFGDFFRDQKGMLNQLEVSAGLALAF